MKLHSHPPTARQGLIWSYLCHFQQPPPPSNPVSAALLQEPRMSSNGSRREKVWAIFLQFDTNIDGGLNRSEMAALVTAVNPRVKFSDEQINAILDEVFRTYSEFIDDKKGLSFDGLLRTYDDGAGDVDRDFAALGLQVSSCRSSDHPSALSLESSSPSIADEQPAAKSRVWPWAASPNNGIVYDRTWKILEDLDILIKRLRAKQLREGRIKGDVGVVGGDVFSDSGWSRDLSLESDVGVVKRVIWDESGSDYSVFGKELREIRARTDKANIEEAFDGHMAIGRCLYDHQLFREALVSFRRATELQPTDVRPHFRMGNALYSLGRNSEAKEAYELALEVAEHNGNQWCSLLPQIHVNLGIALEGEGMLLGACEHYREAAILCPTHYRALKLLGSALFGVGEYRAAAKALEEAIFLKPDYADAHCDLGSALHAMQEDEKAIQEFQKAIDLKSDHLDALYNLGGLFRDVGRYQRASEMYGRVLAIWPNHWRAQLNRAVSLLGAGEAEDARKSLKEAFKMTNRVELYDAIAHLKKLQKKPKGLSSIIRKEEPGQSGVDSKEGMSIVDASRFKRANDKTTHRQYLANALQIRTFQRITRLGRCGIDQIKKELDESKVPVSYSGNGMPVKSIRKAALEVILRRLLHFLRPDTFQGAVKAIDERVLGVLDGSSSGRVDLGMFYALLAPICAGSSEMRKRVAFDALLWRFGKGTGAQIGKADASAYMRFLRIIYFPSQEVSVLMEVRRGEDSTMIAFPEFFNLFDDTKWGFGILDTLVKLEDGDRVRHSGQSCGVCKYPIIGPRFKELTSGFSLCAFCYSEGRVPISFKQDEYKFKEYWSETEAMKDKLRLFGVHSDKSPDDS